MERTQERFIGCDCPLRDIREITNKINEKVVEKINDTQELVMINDFARETNENIFKQCLQERISEISSWRWVLEDLTKRLDEASAGLKYELRATNVVKKRLDEEIAESSKSKPGVLCPRMDSVELALKEETRFLNDQRQAFEDLGRVLEDQLRSIERTKSKIKMDILNKEETLALEEAMASISLNTLGSIGNKQRAKKKPTTLERWQNRCRALKQEGLRALNDALLAKQQVKGARLQLSIASQAHSNQVDAALKKRLHVNQAKLQEMLWQKDEALNDLKSLQEEQKNTEQSLLVNLEQEKVIEARLADRSLRPNGEQTRDDVDRKLRDELARVRRFIKDLRCNLDDIAILQKHLEDAVTKIDCLIADVETVIELDEERIKLRNSEFVDPLRNVSLSHGRGSSGGSMQSDIEPRSNIPTDSTETDNIQRGSIQTDSIQRGSTLRDSLHRGSIQRDSIPRGSTRRDSMQRGSMQRDSMQLGSMQRDSMQRGSMQRDSMQRNSTQRDSMQRGSMQRDSMQRRSTQRDSRQRGTEKDSMQRGSVQRESIPRTSIMQRESVPRGKIQRDGVPRVSIKEDFLPREVSRSASTERDSVSRSSSALDDLARDIHSSESTQSNSSVPRFSTELEITQSNDSQREGTQTDSVPQGRMHRDSVLIASIKHGDDDEDEIPTYFDASTIVSDPENGAEYNADDRMGLQTIEEVDEHMEDLESDDDYPFDY